MASVTSKPPERAVESEESLSEQQCDLSGASREDLVALVQELVDARFLSQEIVKGTLQIVQTKTAASVKAASTVTSESVKNPVAVSRGPEIIIGSPEKKLLTKLEEDYEKQAEDLCATGQANEGMFSRLQIIKALTPEVLARALQIEKLGKGATPRGLLIPDNDRYGKVAGINDHKLISLEKKIVISNADDKDLWNGGQKWPEKTEWQYKIFQGEQDVDDVSGIRGSNFQRSKTLVRKIRMAGFDVLTGIDHYLVAMRRALLEGKPLDPRTITVINAKNLAELSSVAYGAFRRGVVILRCDHYSTARSDVRVRASMDVL